MTLPGNKKLVCVGSYRLTGRRLGRGNFAKVEEAVHTVLKAKVALKVMNVSEIKEEYVVRNLHREAKLLSQLSHPCIARLYETMQSGSIYYMVTELVAGGDLCTFIKAQRSGKLDEKFTKLFAKQLVSALSHMHSLGIVHRDLKMENIMLNEAKTHLKIVDFGLSNFWSPDSPLHTHCGSPEYAAPELFLTGQLYGPEVDMWSLGVILYGMVMGQLPFLTSRDQRISSQDRRKHLLAQINRGLSTSHRKALGSFSIEFRGILARLLTPDPSKRMRVVDIIRHPWITDHGRKQLRIGALRELDTIWKNIIIQEIAKLMGVDIMRIEYSIRNEPYGIIGGMYNILAYRRMIRQTTITKDENINHRPITVHSSVVRSTTKQHILRPITTSVNEKRPTEQWDADLNGTPSRLRVVGTKGVSRTYNLRSAANKTNLEDSAHKCSHTNKNCNNTLPDQTINRQIKSEPLDNSSLTTNPNKTTVKRRKSHPVCNGKDPPNRKISEKNSLKLRSKLTRSNTQKKKPKTPDLPSNTEKKTLRNSKHSTTTANSHHTCCQHNSSAPVSKKLLNEPIARCIAGYVSNYIQLDVNKCKWIKDLTAYKPGNKNVNESTTKKTNAVRR